MRIFNFGLILVCASLVVSCSSSGPTQTTVNSGETHLSSADSSAEPDRMICKKVVPTGSRLGTKTCKTVREWDEIQRRAQDALDRSVIKSGQQSQEGG